MHVEGQHRQTRFLARPVNIGWLRAFLRIHAHFAKLKFSKLKSIPGVNIVRDMVSVVPRTTSERRHAPADGRAKLLNFSTTKNVDDGTGYSKDAPNWMCEERNDFHRLGEK